MISPGSVQLRLYRIARRDGGQRPAACLASGIGCAEAAFIDADDARDPPEPQCFWLPLSAAHAAIGGIAAVQRLTRGAV